MLQTLPKCSIFPHKKRMNGVQKTTQPLQQINWGIIGCGDVTEVKSGPAFNKVKNSKLVAVMRRDANKAADYARRHGVEKWYSDAGALINDPDVNAIYIATPPSSHLPYALAALSAGKPVYLEKPMTMNGAEARQMAEASGKTGVKLTVAHYRRMQPMFLKLKSLIDEKAIGEIRFVQLQLLQDAAANLVAATEENWRTNPAVSGGGLFHDLAPHQIDLMLYFFGPVRKYSGMATSQAHPLRVDDMVTGSILFENNILFNGIWNFNVHRDDATDRCIIFGSEGRIEFGVFGQEIIIYVNGKKERLAFAPLQHVQQPMIEAVVSYFLNGDNNPCSAETGVEVMNIMDIFSAH